MNAQSWLLCYFNAWRNSLQLFWPKNFIPFLQNVANSALRTYQLLFTHYWWLLLLTIGCQLLFFYNAPFTLTNQLAGILLNIWSLAIGVLWFLVGFLIYVLTQHKGKIKNPITLLQQNIKYFIYFILFTIVINAFTLVGLGLLLEYVPYVSIILYFIISYLFLGMEIPYPFSNLFNRILYSVPFKSIEQTILYTLLPFVSPFFAYYVFFLLDSDASITSIGQTITRAYRMVVYNYPANFIFFIFWYIVFNRLLFIKNILFNPPAFYSSTVLQVIFLAIVPFVVAWMHTFYAQQLKSQRKRYVGK